MSIDWFRSWHGAPTDPKWMTIARRANVPPGMVSAVAWALFDYASQNTDRGSVAGFDAETYAVYAGWDEADIARIIASLRDKGVISPDDRLNAWERRQPKREDYSTERVRQHRKRADDDETQCNAEERSETPGNARLRVEKDKDKEKNNEGASADAATPLPSFGPLRVYEENGGKYPRGKLADGTPRKTRAQQFIIERVCDDPASLTLWGRVVAGYCAQWSATSYTVMVNDYYLTGRIPGVRSNGNGKSATGRAYGLAALRSKIDDEYDADNTPDKLAAAQAEWDRRRAERERANGNVP